MTIKLEFHYNVANLEATSKHFIESGAAKTAVSRTVEINSIEVANAYILSCVKRVLQREDVLESIHRDKNDAFVLYGKVWLAIQILKNPSYQGADLVLDDATKMKEVNSINQMDHGVKGMLEVDIQSPDSLSVIVKGKFLVYLNA